MGDSFQLDSSSEEATISEVPDTVETTNIVDQYITEEFDSISTTLAP